jgi:hypothetical protein
MMTYFQFFAKKFCPALIRFAQLPSVRLSRDRLACMSSFAGKIWLHVHILWAAPFA